MPHRFVRRSRLLTRKYATGSSIVSSLTPVASHQWHHPSSRCVVMPWREPLRRPSAPSRPAPPSTTTPTGTLGRWILRPWHTTTYTAGTLGNTLYKNPTPARYTGTDLLLHSMQGVLPPPIVKPDELVHRLRTVLDGYLINTESTSGSQRAPRVRLSWLHCCWTQTHTRITH